MKKSFPALMLTLILACTACTSEKSDECLRIRGTAQATAQLYLYEILDETNLFVRQLDTIPVLDGGAIDYRNDSIKAGLYFVSPLGKSDIYEALERGKILFLSNGLNKLTWSEDDQATLADSPVNDEYQAFIQKKNELADRSVLDSLDALFYAARDRNDTVEMARLNEVSTPISEAGNARVNSWISGLLKEQRTDLFGSYLFYRYTYSRTALVTTEDVEQMRQSLERFGPEAKAGSYYIKMQQGLDRAQKTVIGALAPDISGETPDGDHLSLSDLRGRYVLVDFWSSSCSWCRKETPYLQKVYNRYKDKNFVVLGVSSDIDREEWTNAIEADGADWSHILLSEEDKNAVFKEYSIVGIPQIYLIDPDGKIADRDLRGPAILEAVAELIK